MSLKDQERNRPNIEYGASLRRRLKIPYPVNKYPLQVMERIQSLLFQNSFRNQKLNSLSMSRHGYHRVTWSFLHSPCRMNSSHSYLCFFLDCTSKLFISQCDSLHVTSTYLSLHFKLRMIRGKFKGFISHTFEISDVIYISIYIYVIILIIGLQR